MEVLAYRLKNLCVPLVVYVAQVGNPCPSTWVVRSRFDATSVIVTCILPVVT